MAKTIQSSSIHAAVLDFAKAFDKVPHRRLLRKLQYYGIQGSLLNCAWERVVQYTKKTLKAVPKDRVVHKEALRTSLVETDGILNSRPITHVSSVAGDIEALTFQITYCFCVKNPSYEDAVVTDREVNSTKLWLHSQARANFFWRRFTKEYLTSLTERKRWKENTQNLKVGEVVLVSKPNQQRGIWPLGRVVSTHPGQDGRVCAVTVPTRNGEFKRPITTFVY
ncbi:uncharacterized protein [Montipora capricornis]|uniref:uncharacterized protein n=1 Tax=Montipora capricornis TaxID=246305 RepID=UPI0035F14C39